MTENKTLLHTDESHLYMGPTESEYFVTPNLKANYGAHFRLERPFEVTLLYSGIYLRLDLDPSSEMAMNVGPTLFIFCPDTVPNVGGWNEQGLYLVFKTGTVTWDALKRGDFSLLLKEPDLPPSGIDQRFESGANSSLVLPAPTLPTNGGVEPQSPWLRM